MRALAKGAPFKHTSVGYNFEDAEGQRFTYQTPVFSEAYLYYCMDKDNARFVLAVAEEYSKAIEALGPDTVRAILESDPDSIWQTRVGAVAPELLEVCRDMIELAETGRLPLGAHNRSQLIAGAKDTITKIEGGD